MYVYVYPCVYLNFSSFVLTLFFKENRFTKCSSCTHYKKVLESTMDKCKRKEIEDILEQHIKLVMYVSFKLRIFIAVIDDILR